MLDSKIQIYICHYPPLTDRKKYLDTILPELNIPYEFFNFYNRENINLYEEYFSTDQKVLDFKNSVIPQKVSEPLISPSIKATNLEHVRIYNAILEKECEYHLVLEDDAVLCSNFKNELLHTIKNLPSDWDIIYVSSGCGGRPQVSGIDGSNFAKIESKISWTSNGYLIKKETAKKFIENIQPMILPIDFEQTFLQNFLNLNVYWLVKPIVYEGSNPAAGEHYNYSTSQIR